MHQLFSTKGCGTLCFNNNTNKTFSFIQISFFVERKRDYLTMTDHWSITNISFCKPDMCKLIANK